jgi:N-acetylglutamate synthase-like GNAT family acetyltransferase
MVEAEIRAGRPADIEPVISLLRAAGLPAADFSDNFTGNFLVASAGPFVVGSIALEPFVKLGLLRSLVVNPDYRGGGLGRLLVGEMEAHARRHGISELWLLTIDADRFFRALGYGSQKREQAPDVIRRTTEFSLLCPDDAILMKKRL